jgi:hypothetical protein
MKGGDMSYLRCRSIALIGVLALIYAFPTNAQNQENLTEEQIRAFLLNAKVLRYTQSNRGVTRPYRLTLSDGSITHDASFQSIDEYKPSISLDNGKTEINFRDSYKYNIAAYELAKMLGLADMMPVTIERKWQGKIGSLSWWLPSKMDERQRIEKHIQYPDPVAWAKQWHKLMVFMQLVYDTDRNRMNVLISEDWHLWMIDFSRAFRLYNTLEDPKSLVQCDRQLFQKLRQLDVLELKQKTKDWLSEDEIKGLMERRDKIVALFESLIAKKGENAVLYN